MCIIFVDRNKLMTLTAVNVTDKTPWYDSGLAPCPIQAPEAFENNLRNSKDLRSPARNGSIYKEMTNATNNKFWNGIGTSHSTLICPDEEENMIMCKQWRNWESKLKRSF